MTQFIQLTNHLCWGLIAFAMFLGSLRMLAWLVTGVSL